MAMVVQHNMRAMNANRMLSVNTSTQAKSTEKLSSGYRINRAADDAAGLAISEKMRRQVRGLTQASRNASDGVSMVQTAEGALNEVHEMLQRMSELAVQASSDSYQDTDKGYLNSEVSKLMEEITRTANNTTFNEISLLSGPSTKSIQVGTEAGQTIKITLSKMDADGIGLSGVSIASKTDATAALAKIKTAINSVSSFRSELGATQNRLEHTIKNLDNVVENTSAAESQIRDTDMASEMVKLSNINILAQAGQAMLAQANQGNQGVLALLQ